MTGRTLSTAVAEAMQASDVRPFLLFEGTFASGTVRLWTGLGPLQWAGQTWTGLGNLVGISDVEETSEVVAQGVTVTLSGVPPETVSLALVEVLQGRPGRILLGFLDAAGAVIPDPTPLFAGRLSTTDLQDGESTCSVTVSYENRLQDLLTERGWRYTDQMQRIIDPGDGGFYLVAALQQKEITWNS